MNISNSNSNFQFQGGLTVLMSVYINDKPLLLEKAINSVYENTLLPENFLLVVDGPIRQDLESMVLKLFKKYDFQLLRLVENVGLANALNIGLTKVTTKWVARADADDFNLPNRFALQAEAINNSKVELDIVGGAIQEVDQNGLKLGIRRTVESHCDILRFVKSRNPFNHMTVVFKVDSALRCGGYPNIYLKEDYAFWVSMLSNGAKSLNLSEILVYANAGEAMYQRRGGLKYALAEFELQKHLFLSELKSLPTACIDGVLRSFIFILPAGMRGLIYKYFLRVR